MAYSKAFTLILVMFTISLLMSCSNSRASPESKHEHKNSSSAFDFIKHLQGCHKGQKVKGVDDLKKYLQHFGYLSYQNKSAAKNDDFDDELESAVKTYQLNYHLNATGSLDSETVSKMTVPRCGVADIIKGSTRMESGKRHNSSMSSKFHLVSHYTFFRGNPKWPANKYRLRYGFLPGTPAQAMEPVRRAFRTWEANTHFSFEGVEDYRSGDITVGFHRRSHGDGAAFDGQGGILAHAFAPQDGRFHYDGDERWSVGAAEGAFDLETVAVHEIGHLLGLGHSSVEGAIMYPSIAPGLTKSLHPDDIQGIKALYNL